MKPSYTKLVEVWRALSREHLLCDILPMCHSQTPSFYFGKNDSFKLPTTLPQNLYFVNFQL